MRACVRAVNRTVGSRVVRALHVCKSQIALLDAAEVCEMTACGYLLPRQLTDSQQASLAILHFVTNDSSL